MAEWAWMALAISLFLVFLGTLLAGLTILSDLRFLDDLLVGIAVLLASLSALFGMCWAGSHVHDEPTRKDVHVTVVKDKE